MQAMTRTNLAMAARVVCLGLGMCACAHGQRMPSVPATDASTQASPVGASAKGPDVDGSVQASPEVGPILAGGPRGFAPHTALPVTLSQAIDSGKLKNGQHVAGKLSAAVGRIPAGTPVDVSVIATVPAGALNAAGEFSLELVAVGRVPVYTETQTFRGIPGKKDLPDSAPTMGTDAGLPQGAPLTFHIQPPPVPATDAPNPGDGGPGSVTGRASGSPPPPRAAPAGAGNGAANAASGTQQAPATPGITTPSGNPAGTQTGPATTTPR